ncbi:MAG: tRNA (guanosine-2'-O-)-methyltransferase [Cognaticolwellia sp.]|jgi:tRNA (guanosine-2'-O-)-methyltransferase
MSNSKSTIRQRADEIKEYQCKNLIAVLENPMDIKT